VYGSLFDVNQLLQSNLKQIRHRICKVDDVFCPEEAGSHGLHFGKVRERWSRFRAITRRASALLARLITQCLWGNAANPADYCGHICMLWCIYELNEVDCVKRKESGNREEEDELQ